MKITALIENKLGLEKDLAVEHGLSLFIEVDGKNILFDTGQSGQFTQNAKKLDIDLKTIDYVIISHGHYDHSGGFKDLVEEIGTEFVLYVGKDFFKRKYKLNKDNEYEDIGNPFDEEYIKEKNISIQYIEEDEVKLSENLSIFTNFDRVEEFENTNQRMFLKDQDAYIIDPFFDEICLGINTDKGLILMVGCSHVGIVNIIDTIIKRTSKDIYGLIGGTHLVKEDDKKIIKVIKSLREKDIKIIGVCHCTGELGETMLSQELKEAFVKSNTGNIISY